MTIRAIYRHGVLEPLKPVETLAENQQVEVEFIRLPPADEEDAGFLYNPEAEAEWAAMSPWEREGRWPEELTPEQIESRVQAVLRNRGLIKVDDPDEALHLATDDSLLEWNLHL